MAISYKKLWKILIDKDMNKTGLQKAAGVSWGVISKLSKNESVNIDSIIKICRVLGCGVDDIMEILPEDGEAASEQP